MKIAISAIQQGLDYIARPKNELIHYLVNLSAMPENQRQDELERIRHAIAQSRETKSALPDEIQKRVTPVLSIPTRANLRTHTRTAEPQIELSMDEKLKPGHFLVSFTQKPEDQLDRLIDVSRVPLQHREEAFKLAKQLMHKTQARKSDCPPHLQETLLPVVETLIARRKRENKQRRLTVQQRQLEYLLSLERKVNELEPSALKKVKSLIKKKLPKVAKVHLNENRPSAAAYLFNLAKRHEEGADLLLQRGHGWWAAQLYLWSGKPFTGAKKLAKTRPELAWELFKEAKKPLEGAKFLLQRRKPNSTHAYWAARSFATAGEYDEGIRVMRRIKLPGLASELKRQKSYAGGYAAFRQATDEIKRVRMERLGGKPRK